ncbi:helix-turn-helix domain-containing protein [Actinoplanes sp. NPDC023801]|uniref:helix-turn-helix domain-containing protein n=1 Tax=Actinoplanes sp. NPDC023801 TaxID=3154595 RepID=UPI0033D3EA4B
MGTLRIQFTAEDVSRTRLARADPAWEIVCSLHRLQTGRRHPSYLGYAGWHARVRRDLQHAGLTGVVNGQLLPLTRLGGYFPDFLTPEPAGELGESLDAILRTPRRRLRAEMRRLRAAPGAAAWLDDLATGRAPALAALGDSLRRYHEVAVTPYRKEIDATTAHDRANRGVKALGALGDSLQDLGPRVTWAPPVLSVEGYVVDRDVLLRGRGITLVPSFFCWHTPIALADPELPPMLVYPARRQRPAHAVPPGERLGPLIGRTRLAVLRAAASGATTGELARRTGIAAATASHHATVLREAGLIASIRDGNLMVHHLTSLGDSLLGQGGAV